MLCRFLKICAALVLVFCFTNLNAQEAIVAAGGDASGPGGSASYSVGQVFYHTFTGTNGYSIAEGIQQPYEISVITRLSEKEGNPFTFRVYPNPTRDILNIQIGNYNNEDLEYLLFDIRGDLLRKDKISGDKKQLPMSGLSPGTYILKIIYKQKEIEVFKIIKN